MRDAFVALCFVTMGMLIDPRTLLSNWKLLAVMIGLILFGKSAVWSAVVRVFGYPTRTALRVGTGLTQIGEFSFILAQVAQHSGLVAKEVYNATLAASLVTILANATFYKWMKNLSQLSRKGEFPRETLKAGGDHRMAGNSAAVD